MPYLVSLERRMDAVRSEESSLLVSFAVYELRPDVQEEDVFVVSSLGQQFINGFDSGILLLVFEWTKPELDKNEFRQKRGSMKTNLIIKLIEITSHFRLTLRCRSLILQEISNTDTYRNNMNDFVLIHLTEDEIYVRPLTVYILQFYQLKNPQGFIILS